MTDISYPILRTGKTDIAGSVVVTPSGGSTGTAIIAADLVNGFAGQTVSFAAGETSKTVRFPVADDSAVEGTETYRLTMSNPQPSGAFPNGAFVEGTVADNDTGGGGGAPPTSFGPASTADTQFIDTKSNAHTLQATVVRVGQTFQWAIQDSDGLSRFEVVVASDAVIEGYYYPPDGSARIGVTRLQHGVTGGIVGKKMIVNYRATDDILITIGGNIIHDGGTGFGVVGTGARIITGGAATPDAQINAN